MRKIDIPETNGVVLLSDRSDGNMKFAGADTMPEMIRDNRNRIERVLGSNGLKASNTAFILPDYNGTNFCRYEIVDSARGGGWFQEYLGD